MLRRDREEAISEVSKWTSFTACSSTTQSAKRAQAIVRGIRAVTDYEYEFQMALMNRRLAPADRNRLHDAGGAVLLSEFASREGDRRTRRIRRRAWCRTSSKSD